MTETNHVILVDERDNPVGTMEKMQAHTTASLHRAVSVFIINSKGEWLLQKRALNKYHSPGLWTNACCTHPFPDESNIYAARRRLMEEMWLFCDINEIFSFVYKDKLDNNITEYEFDHVFIGVCDDKPHINPDEVAVWQLIPFKKLHHDVQRNPQDYTSWFRKIYKQVNEHINENKPPLKIKQPKFSLFKDYLKAGRVDLAIGAVSLIVLGLSYMDVLPSAVKIIAMLICAFFGNLGIYAFNNVTDYDEDLINKPRSAIIAERIRKQNLLIYSLACKLVAIISALFISWGVFTVVSIIIAGSIFYSQRSVGGGRLKDVFIIKNITIALLWSFVPLIPMLTYGSGIPYEYFIIVSFMFISSFISCMTSDLKDIEGDRNAGIKTFPTVYGEKTTLFLLILTNTLGLIAITAGWLFLNLKLYLLLILLVIISRYYSFWLIYTKKRTADFAYNKIDSPTDTAIGLLALIGRFLIH